MPLNQWFYTSFTIKDGEASKSFQDLVDIYLRPGMMTIARSVDRAVLGRVHGFLGAPTQRVGRLANLSADNSKDYVLEAREQLNINKAPLEGRNLVLAPVSETALLKNELFIAAQHARRLRHRVGERDPRDGFWGSTPTWTRTSTASRQSNCDVDVTGTVTNALAAGCGRLAGGHLGRLRRRTSASSPSWPATISRLTLRRPPRAAGATTAITLNEANKYATLAAAPLTVYKACVVANAFARRLGSQGIVLHRLRQSAADRPVGRLRHGRAAARPTR